MAIILNDIGAKDEKIVLPLHHLVTQLRQNGFIIRPDDYIEMLKVVEQFGNEEFEDLAPRFCPLIATSPEEQERFYKVFEEYQKQHTEPSLPRLLAWWSKIRTHFGKYYRHWLIGVGLLLILFYALHLLKAPAPPLSARFTISKLSGGDTTYRVGDTLLLDASATTGHQKHTEEVQYFWNTGSGFVKGRPTLKTVLHKQGTETVQLKVRSLAQPVKDSMQSTSFRVCPHVKVPSFGYEQQYTVEQVLELNAGSFKTDNNFQQVYWKVNNRKQEALTNEGTLLRLPFDSAGIYQIALIGLYDGSVDENAPCSFVLPLQDILVSEAKNYLINTSYTGQDVTSLLTKKLSPWVYWLLLVPLAATLLWSLAWWLRQRKKVDDKKNDIPAFTGKKLPYETPFENRAYELVQTEAGFRKIFYSFRQKAEDDLIAFNIPRSIYRTIRTGGIPELVFSNRMRYSDYLVLIDATLAKNMQVHLFDYLVHLLNEEAICVERYYYTGKFEKIYNESAPEGMSFRRLSERYKNYTLIIMGSAHQLVYTPYPLLEKELIDILNEWEHKAILTPLPYKDWGQKERLIGEQFVLLPADIPGQLKLIEAVRERQLNQHKYLSSAAGFYSIAGYDFEDANDLEAYLNDEVLFQWLCATAVFHKLRWEILIEQGKVICAHYQEHDKMNFTSLLRLCRISWMEEGVFPAAIRLELLKKLKPENETLARETLLRMMHYADTYFGAGYLFDEEKEVQKVTSRFLLYAHDPAHFADYKEDVDKFKSLWQTDQLWDMPQKVYLDNEDPTHWSSLLHHQNKNIGLKDYFNIKKKDEVVAQKKFLMRNALIAATLVVILGVLHLLKNRLPSDSIFISSSAPSSALFTVAVRDDITCEGAHAIETIQGSVRTSDGMQHQLNFEKGTLTNDTQQYYMASLNLPVATDGFKSVLQLQWNGTERNQTAAPVLLNNDKMMVTISACALSKRYNVTVYYNDSSRRSEALRYATILTDAGYYIDSILYEQFTDSSHVDYFSETDKAIADSMASLLSVFDQRFGTTGYGAVLNDNTGNYRKQFDVIIHLAKEKTEPVSARLPSFLSEIWRGATNNRLMAIDVNRQIIYYSTGDRKTYGTYRIEEVWKLTDDVYKVITRADQRYAVFLMRNIQAASLEFSVCQDRYSSIEEARAVAEGDCDPFNRMIHYFESDPDRFYLNYSRNNFPVSQQSKLQRYIRARTRVDRNAGYSVSLSSNRLYATTRRIPQSLLVGLNKAGLRQGTYQVGNIQSFRGGPFERDYIALTPSSTPLEDAPIAQTQTEPETLLTTINLDQNFDPSPGNRSWQEDLQMLMKYLQGYSNVSLRFVAYYDPSSSREAQVKLTRLRNYLGQQFGRAASSKQIRYVTQEAPSNKAQQNKNVSSYSKEFQIDVYGSGFPSDLLRGQSKY